MYIKINTTETKTVRIFQMGFRGDWIEIHKMVPPPEFDGEFFLAFRKKEEKKLLTLFSGITEFGAKTMISEFKKSDFDSINLIFQIERLSQKN